MIFQALVAIEDQKDAVFWKAEEDKARLQPHEAVGSLRKKTRLLSGLCRAKIICRK
jgi:hypothetical protein